MSVIPQIINISTSLLEEKSAYTIPADPAGLPGDIDVIVMVRDEGYYSTTSTTWKSYKAALNNSSTYSFGFYFHRIPIGGASIDYIETEVPHNGVALYVRFLLRGIDPAINITPIIDYSAGAIYRFPSERCVFTTTGVVPQTLSKSIVPGAIPRKYAVLTMLGSFEDSATAPFSGSDIIFSDASRTGVGGGIGVYFKVIDNPQTESSQYIEGSVPQFSGYLLVLEAEITERSAALSDISHSSSVIAGTAKNAKSDDFDIVHFGDFVDFSYYMYGRKHAYLDINFSASLFINKYESINLSRFTDSAKCSMAFDSGVFELTGAGYLDFGFFYLFKDTDSGGIEIVEADSGIGAALIDVTSSTDYGAATVQPVACRYNAVITSGVPVISISPYTTQYFCFYGGKTINGIIAFGAGVFEGVEIINRFDSPLIVDTDKLATLRITGTFVRITG